MFSVLKYPEMSLFCRNDWGNFFFYHEGENLKCQKSYVWVLKMITWAQEFSITCEISKADWNFSDTDLLFHKPDLFCSMLLLKELNFSMLCNFKFLLYFNGFYILKNVVWAIWLCKICHDLNAAIFLHA